MTFSWFPLLTDFDVTPQVSPTIGSRSDFKGKKEAIFMDVFIFVIVLN
jgi:hypothetical protein